MELSSPFEPCLRRKYMGTFNKFSSFIIGASIIDDTLAFIDAPVVAEYLGGDHVIFLGQVVAMGVAGRVIFAREVEREHITVVEHGSNGTEKAPLAYYLGQYRHLCRSYRKPSLPDLAAYVQKET
jgi:flavin reductase (DIM6/NTAB) family NADH-FMN oxidoreductase RutF